MVKVLEDIVIISIGMWMHFYQISIVELQISTLLFQIPNITSSSFVFTVLFLLTKSRPIWPESIRQPPKLLLLPIDLFLILLGTECFYRKIWMLALKITSFYFHCLIDNILPNFMKWVYDEEIYQAQFRLDTFGFIYFEDVFKLLVSIIEKLFKRNTTSVESVNDDGDECEDEETGAEETDAEETEAEETEAEETEGEETETECDSEDLVKELLDTLEQHFDKMKQHKTMNEREQYEALLESIKAHFSPYNVLFDLDDDDLADYELILEVKAALQQNEAELQDGATSDIDKTTLEQNSAPKRKMMDDEFVEWEAMEGCNGASFEQDEADSQQDEDL